MKATHKKTRGSCHQGVRSSWADTWPNEAQARTEPHVQWKRCGLRSRTCLKLNSARCSLVTRASDGVLHLLTGEERTQLRAPLWGLKKATDTRVAAGHQAATTPPLPLPAPSHTRGKVWLGRALRPLKALTSVHSYDYESFAWLLQTLQGERSDSGICSKEQQETTGEWTLWRKGPVQTKANPLVTED